MPGNWVASLSRILCCVVAALAAGMGNAEELEVLHYWQPEDKGTVLLKETLKRQGHTWKDFVIVPGGANGLLNSILKSRVQSGNPPFAAIIRAPVARHWARAGQLASLDEVAKAGQWDQLLPRAIRDSVKDGDHYVAVPLNIYRENGLWINNRLMKRAGAKAPSDWNSFFDAAEKLRRAGIVAVAHGGQQRMSLHLFSNVALGVGGPDFYRRAFVLHDASELSGKAMEEVLRTFRRIKPYTEVNVTQRDWQDVSTDVIENKAAMVFIGGGAGPLFAAAKARSGFDYSCMPSPGSAGAFVYGIDSFAMFRSRSAEKTRAQQEFAGALLTASIQAQFNLDRGAFPAREGVDIGKLGACEKDSAAAFRKAEESNAQLPSFPLAMSAPVEVALAEVVTAFWADDSMSPRTAIDLIAAAMK